MKEKILLTVAVVALCVALGWVKSLKAQVDYADFNCPTCGSNEVLDYGETHHGTHYQCYDCKTEFYAQEGNSYE